MKPLFLWAIAMGMLFGVFDHLLWLLDLYYGPPNKPEEFPFFMYLFRRCLFATAMCLPKAIVERSVLLAWKALLFGTIVGIITVLLPLITMPIEVFMFVTKMPLGFLAGSMVSNNSGVKTGRIYSCLGGIIGGGVSVILNVNLWLVLMSIGQNDFRHVILPVFYALEFGSYWLLIAKGQELGQRGGLFSILRC